MKNAAEVMDFSVIKTGRKSENPRWQIENKRRHSARVGYNTRHLFAIAYLKETDMSLLNVPAGKDLPEDIYVVIEILRTQIRSNTKLTKRAAPCSLTASCPLRCSIRATTVTSTTPCLWMATRSTFWSRHRTRWSGFSDPLPSGWRTENDRRIR